jgi:hypothetical protein
LYADPSFDITELVKAELEKTKPVEEEPETATEEAPEATVVPAE